MYLSSAFKYPDNNMKNSSRRKFISDSTKIAAGIGFINLASNTETEMSASKNLFVHHVYFWLNNADSAEDLKKLLAGLESLTKIKTIKM